jgi:hypothetical protein
VVTRAPVTIGHRRDWLSDSLNKRIAYLSPNRSPNRAGDPVRGVCLAVARGVPSNPNPSANSVGI